MTIGERVIAILEEKDVKQKALADFLNTKPSTIHGWKAEGRNPSSEIIIPICEFLGVSPEYLLTGNESVSSIYNDTDPHFTELKDLYYRLPDRQQGELIGYAKRMVEEIAAKTSIPEEEEAHDPPGGVAGN